MVSGSQQHRRIHRQPPHSYPTQRRRLSRPVAWSQDQTPHCFSGRLVCVGLRRRGRRAVYGISPGPAAGLGGAKSRCQRLGTDQEFILLQRWFDRYQPDVVVLVLSDDDLFTNAHNEFLYSYYKPYFEEVDGQLVEHGVPVPKSIRYYCREHPLLFRSRLAQLLFARYLRWRAPFYACPNNPTLPILLAMKNYAQAKGARFAMGFVTDVQADGKRAFCAAGKIDSLFLLEAPFQKWDYIYPTLGNHWTPKGHQLVSDVLYSFLLTNKFVTQP